MHDGGQTSRTGAGSATTSINGVNHGCYKTVGCGSANLCGGRRRSLDGVCRQHGLSRLNRSALRRRGRYGIRRRRGGVDLLGGCRAGVGRLAVVVAAGAERHAQHRCQCSTGGARQSRRRSRARPCAQCCDQTFARRLGFEQRAARRPGGHGRPLTVWGTLARGCTLARHRRRITTYLCKIYERWVRSCDCACLRNLQNDVFKAADLSPDVSPTLRQSPRFRP